MIVTCPSCNAKYRVKNEAVPSDGARLQCPSCNTLFLAMLPKDAPSSIDDQSSMYQQLIPASVPPRPGAFAPVAPTAALHAAPPSTADAGAPSTPTQSPGQLPSTPPITVHTVARNTTAGPARAESAPTIPRVPSAVVDLASWLTIGLGAAAGIVAVVFTLWSSEVLMLDGLLMATAERTFGVEPPYSFTGRDDPAPDVLRDRASAAQARGDLATALVAWQRVKQRSPSDARATVQIAKIRAELGELDGGS